MALQGNLRDFSVTEILQLLGTQKKTGCLMLEWNTERALVYVVDGRIVSTRDPGMPPDDPLLQFLLKVHRLSDEQRRGIQSIHKESGRDLSELLVTGRYIETEELVLFIERQILNDLMRLVRWENGSYRFDAKRAWPGQPLVRMSMEGALIEAARRVDEQKRFVTRFKDPYELLGLHDLPGADEPVAEEEKELFGIIDGHRTVAEIVEAAPLSEYEAYESLYRMLEARWIEVVGRRDPGITLTPSPVRVVRAPAPKVSFVHEVFVGAIIVAATLGLQFGARSLRTAAASRPVVADAFLVARTRDVDMALNLYRREHGVYPHTIDALVDGNWLAPDQASWPGTTLRYEPASDCTAYRLRFDSSR